MEKDKGIKMKTVSLETAKQLKEAGFPQNTEFYYFNHFADEWLLKPRHNVTHVLQEYNKLAASSPSADEILDELPLYLKEDSEKGIAFSVETYGLHIHKSYDNKKWAIGYAHRQFTSESLAECAGQMYLYLKKEGLI